MEVMRTSHESHPKCAGISKDATDGLYKKGNCIWIPGQDLELQLKVMVCSHCGVIGHRDKDATKSIIQETFWWPTIDKDVEEMVRKCYHCIVTPTGEIVPRPLGHALHGERPNEVVHMDFLFMGNGLEGKEYLLILRDDFYRISGCGLQRTSRLLLLRRHYASGLAFLEP